MVLWVAIAAAEQLERGPVAWALAVEGDVAREPSGTLQPGQAIEPGARFVVPTGASVLLAHAGTFERWEGPSEVRVERDGVRVTLAGTPLWRPHTPEGTNALTGDVRVPAGRGQELSALGIPLTEDAWARQDAIDGGLLHVLYLDLLSRRIATAGADRSLLERLDLVDALPGDTGEQVALVSSYLDLAVATPDAAMVLELFPTDVRLDVARRNLGSTLGEALLGVRPHTFRVSPVLDRIRVYPLGLAEVVRSRRRTAFALVIPYANTVENIVARVGRPGDGVEVLHQYLTRLGGKDSPVETTAIGYSQGAAVVRDYLVRYGDHDGLDFAVSLATMGGVDAAGGEGVWAGHIGEGGGTRALAVVHAEDPARKLHGRSLIGLWPKMTAFLDDEPGRELHECHFGAPCGPLPPGLDREAALRAGIFGYPAPYLAALYEALYGDRFRGAFARRGEWRFDVREELTGWRTGDFTGTKLVPTELVERWLPAVGVE